MIDCSICKTALTSERDATVPISYCPRCGPWQWIAPKKPGTLRFEEQVPRDNKEALRRSNLSHKVRRMGRGGEPVGVPLDDLPRWGLDDPLPTPTEQANALVLWVGDNQPSHSEPVPADQQFLAAWLGVAITHPDNPGRGLAWLLNQPSVLKLVEITNRASGLPLRLTWEGWGHYEELKHQESASWVAFMAMEFGHAELNRVVTDCFRPAVAATGFTLRLLTDDQGAGCIDDQMRVAIRTSRFLLADLTHRNPGAYWEGGFGEGLGKPVIYTCKKAVWETERTHFDTNHLVTIIWDPADLPKAAAELKATIRATLPAVARLTD